MVAGGGDRARTRRAPRCSTCDKPVEEPLGLSSTTSVCRSCESASRTRVVNFRASVRIESSVVPPAAILPVPPPSVTRMGLPPNGGSTKTFSASPMIPPPGTVAVRCFRCARRGFVQPGQLFAHARHDILCPQCRGDTPTSAPLLPAGTAPGPLVSPPLITFPPEYRRPLVGRPPAILTRSRELAGLAPRATAAPEAGATFSVKCFVCGRGGRLPVKPEISLRPEDVICPKCQPLHPRKGLARGRTTPSGRPLPTPDFAGTA